MPLNLKSVANGSVILNPASTVTDKTITLPATDGTMLVQDGTNTTTITNLAYTGTLTGGTGVINIGSGQLVKDAAGNLGLGVTPSAWNTFTALQVKDISLASFTNGDTRLSSNAFYQSGWKYINTRPAVQYLQDSANGVHAWFTAPSGTAGNAISFTQAMTLSATGNLGVGTTTTTNGRVNIQAGTAATGNSLFLTNLDGTINPYLEVQHSSSGVKFFVGNSYSGANNNLIFGSTSTAEAMRIDGNGNLLVGSASNAAKLYVAGVSTANRTIRADTNTTDPASVPVTCINSATTGSNTFVEFYDGVGYRGGITYNRPGGLVAYNTTSDRRAKDIVGAVNDSGSVIDSLKVYNGLMKGATVARPMLIADEAQVVTPYAVTGEKDAVDAEGNPVFQQMDVSSYVPLLIAELQSLRKRVAELEAA